VALIVIRLLLATSENEPATSAHVKAREICCAPMTQARYA
jgi:hypothetical protein